MNKTCKNCGTEFQAIHNRTMYCSNECARISRNMLENNRRKNSNSEQNIKVCSYCQKPLSDNIIQVHHKYCSEECKKQASKKRRDIRRPPKRKHLCWDCSKYINGCTWSEHGIPVVGWEAIQTPRVYRGKEIGINYQVRNCPDYIPG